MAQTDLGHPSTSFVLCLSSLFEAATVARYLTYKRGTVRRGGAHTGGSAWLHSMNAPLAGQRDGAYRVSVAFPGKFKASLR